MPDISLATVGELDTSLLLNEDFCMKMIQIGEKDLKDLKKVLKQELQRRRQNNPQYSLRSFAKHLDISPAYLSRLIRGDRSFSRSMVEKIVTKLPFNPVQIETIKASNEPRARKRDGLKYQQIQEDQIRVLSDWYHYAILALLDLPEFEPKAAWIAKRLNIKTSQANEAIQRLFRLKFLSESSDGRWKESNGPQHTTLGITNTNTYLKELQRQFLELSTSALFKVPIEKRSHTGLTFALDARLIPEIKNRIDKFRRNVHKLAERTSVKKNSVYQISISLFPLTEVN